MRIVTSEPVIKVVERLNEGRVDDESVDVLGNLRMSEDLVDFKAAVVMIEEEDPGNEVWNGGRCELFGNQTQRLQVVGTQETADVLLDFER